MLSKDSTDAYIRNWQRARLGKDCLSLAYPSTNILHPTHGVGTGIPAIDGLSDAERVQRVVEKMPPEIRESFEAFYLGPMTGEVRGKERNRWKALGIGKTTYFKRWKFGWKMVQSYLDTREPEMQNPVSCYF